MDEGAGFGELGGVVGVGGRGDRVGLRGFEGPVEPCYVGFFEPADGSQSLCVLAQACDAVNIPIELLWRHSTQGVLPLRPCPPARIL